MQNSLTVLDENAEKFGWEGGFRELSSDDLIFIRKIISEVISWEQKEPGYTGPLRNEWCLERVRVKNLNQSTRKT